MKKILSGVLAVTLALSIVGCTNGGAKKSDKTEDGKTRIVVGGMPNKDTNKENYEKWEASRQLFMEQNPDIYIEGDSWGFSVDTFSQKAGADQLPHYFYMPFTEAGKCAINGYFRDIGSFLEKKGYLENYSDEIIDLIKTDEGKYYCAPYTAYVLGLLCNKEMYAKAGLTNADGTIKIPDTFDEMAENAAAIKKATGNAGYVIPTKSNAGGWHFMNIARGFGVIFMEEKDGKWIAKFNDENGVAALRYIKDLKWKYDALSNNALIDNPEMHKMFATGNGAMMFSAAIETSLGKTLCVTNGMDRNTLSLGKMPKGPKGRYALMGGGIYALPKSTTDDQAEAVFKWMEYNGQSPDITEDAVKNVETTVEENAGYGIPILSKTAFSVWKSGERLERVDEIYAKYCNVDMNDMQSYYERDDLTIAPEEPYYCQELYSLLDGCIQEVITNKNADVQQLLDSAVQNFQVNYLDNM